MPVVVVVGVLMLVRSVLPEQSLVAVVEMVVRVVLATMQTVVVAVVRVDILVPVETVVPLTEITVLVVVEVVVAEILTWGLVEVV
jgi:hypothetical protein